VRFSAGAPILPAPAGVDKCRGGGPEGLVIAAAWRLARSRPRLTVAGDRIA